MKTRKPRRGEGVPRQTRARNHVADVGAALAAAVPGGRWDALPASLEAAGFFELGLQAQVRAMADAALALGPPGADPDLLVAALGASPLDPVQGVAVYVAQATWAGDLAALLPRLRRTAALPGTWPRELSNTVLHLAVIDHGVEPVLRAVEGWLADPDEAVRRVVVEAFRPRGVMLPHLAALKRDPSPLERVLRPVLDDPSDYVRKAAANNLNDVSLDHPARVLAWSEAWLAERRTSARAWVIERGLRTLVKDAHPRALALLGYADPAHVSAEQVAAPPACVVLDALLPNRFRLANRLAAPARVVLRADLDAPGAGARRRRLSYHLWDGTLAPGEAREVGRDIHFAHKTTQPKLPGRYTVAYTLNGVPVGELAFDFDG